MIGRSYLVLAGLAFCLGVSGQIIDPEQFERRFMMGVELCGGQVCGGEVMGRIVGGTNANATRWRWQASLTFVKRNETTGELIYSVFTCGAILIHEKWVLTAAHCVDWFVDEGFFRDIYRPRLRVILGDYDMSFRDGREQEMKVKNITIHPRYNIVTSENDFALLELAESAVLNENVQVVSLPPRGLRFKNNDCVITGWGTLEQGGVSSDILQEARVPIVKLKECKKIYEADGSGSVITQNMVCAGLLDVGGVDTCQGDSGGPMVCKSRRKGDNRYYLRGVTSFGRGCALPGYPGVYANVKRAVRWIEKTTKLNLTW